MCGVDEAGRGPLAGPVVVVAVILDANRPIAGLDDSKKISASKREALYSQIVAAATAYNIQRISPRIIDEINILQATLRGMQQAALAIVTSASTILIDGNRVPKELFGRARAVVKGDGKYAAIAAASILAKVTRDRIMEEYDAIYPGYGFAQNKGYPTKQHLAAICNLGITPIHRKTYKPVQQLTLDF